MFIRKKRPKFKSLREEFVYDLMERMESDETWERVFNDENRENCMG